MALVRCAECGRAISQHASACPGCGVGMEPMSDEQYARAQAATRAVRDKDNRFALLAFGGLAALIGLSVVFGKSADEGRAEEERAFRRHVSTLDEQQRARESAQFWRGVGMEKDGGRR